MLRSSTSIHLLLIFLLISIDSLSCKRYQGLLTYDNNHKTTNGFGIYTRDLQLKNITSGYPKKASMIKGALATKYNDEDVVIIYGQISCYQNYSLNNIIFYKKGKQFTTFSENLVSNSIDSVVEVGEKLIFIGDIISLDGSIAYNSIICFLDKQCSLLNDGNQIGIPGYLSMLSSSSDGERKAYFVYNKNEGENNYIAIDSWDLIDCKISLKFFFEFF